MQIKVNGVVHELDDVDPDTPLLWVLRDLLHMKGTKFGCGAALCGACTIHFDGAPTRSCVLPVTAAIDHDITTIEGISGPVATAVVNSWISNNVPQCGYCQSGQIMSAVGLLSNNRRPSRSDVDAAMSGNLCRCGTYPRIRAAIAGASDALAQGV